MPEITIQLTDNELAIIEEMALAKHRTARLQVVHLATKHATLWAQQEAEQADTANWEVESAIREEEGTEEPT